MRKIVLIFLLFLFFLGDLNAFDIKSLGTINSYVIDKVGVLNSEEKNEIEQKIEELKTKYTTEILAIIINTTDGEDISSIATQIGQDLGVGKEDKDNGVVILIAIDDRAWNISTGYGVEGVLPDLLANRIGENNFILFREEKYKDGIIGALNDFDKAFSGDTSIISKEKENNENNFLILMIFLYLIPFLTGKYIIKKLKDKKQYKKIFFYLLVGYIITLPLAFYILPYISTLVSNLFFWIHGVMMGVGGKIGNGGGFGGGSSRGGSRGGFGGGGFGGGGSSGRW